MTVGTVGRVSYFDVNPVDRAPGALGTYGRLRADAVEVSPGVAVQPVAGDAVLLSRVTVASNAEAAVHVHIEEQLGVIISGSCEFSLDGEVRTLAEGDTYHAPPGVPHGLVAGPAGCVVIDAFSPPRAALLGLVE